MCETPVSNQGEVWEDIQCLQVASATHSPTNAMKDVYEARQRELDQCLAALRSSAGQQGLVVCVRGKPIGCDYVSRADVYVRVHDKLLRSYVIDALLHSDKEKGKAARKDVARAFLRKTGCCESRCYEEPGTGWDHRFEGKHPAGTALVHEDEVLHQAFFLLEDDVDPRRWRRLSGRAKLSQLWDSPQFPEGP